MKDDDKTRDELIRENEELRQRVGSFEQRGARLATELDSLRTSEARYRQAVETSPNAILTLDKSCTILSWNESCRRVTGCCADEALGKDFSLLCLEPAQDRLLRETLAAVFRGGAFSDLEFEFVDREANKTPMVSRAYPVLDGLGNVVECVLANTDVGRLKSTENALRESEEMFSKAFQGNAFPMVISKIDDERFVQVNDAFLKTLEYEEDEVIGKTSLELGIWVHGSQRDEFSRAVKERGCVREREAIIRTKNGKVLYGLLSADLIQLRDEPHLLTAFHDITRLREAEERFRLAAGVATDLIYEWDVANDALEWFGDIERTLGFGEGEFPRNMDAWKKRIYPDDAARLSDAVERRRRCADPISYEYRIRKKDGGLRYWSDRAAPILDESGRPRKWVGVCTDITDKMTAETALKKSEEKFRTIFEGARDGIFGVDVHTRKAVLASPGMCTLTGYGSQELLELGVDDIHPVEDLPFVLDQFHKLREGEIRVAGDIPVLRKDGTVVYCDISTGFSKYSDQDVFLGFFRDVTERKQAEENLKHALDESLLLRRKADTANQAKSRFLAGMSHEIRTPLNAVIGFSEILHDQTYGELSEKQRRFLGYIIESSRHLLRLLDEVLDLAKVESGKMQLEFEQVTLKEILDAGLVMVQERAMRNSVILELHIDDEAGNLQIRADRVKLLQIMFNLLSNAAKFTPEGGCIRVEAHRKNDLLVVTVADTGIGLSPDDTDRVFEPFEQLQLRSGGKPKGTGLGLSLTRKLVELHGGQICAHSDGPGQGSTFTFAIPIDRQA
ncbi:MAG: PAS domain S-box protein [Pseudomonadota bacterium]